MSKRAALFFTTTAILTNLTVLPQFGPNTSTVLQRHPQPASKNGSKLTALATGLLGLQAPNLYLLQRLFKLG